MSLRRTLGRGLNARGFSLIEVMVALLVLSIGLLGLAAMQGISMTDNNSAYTRAQAQYYAMDIIERMRINQAQAVAGDYDIAFGAAVNPATPEPARADLQGWLDAMRGTAEVKAAIPGSQAQIVRNVVGGETRVIVTVRWSGRGGNAANSFVMETQL